MGLDDGFGWQTREKNEWVWEGYGNNVLLLAGFGGGGGGNRGGGWWKGKVVGTPVICFLGMPGIDPHEKGIPPVVKRWRGMEGLTPDGKGVEEEGGGRV